MGLLPCLEFRAAWTVLVEWTVCLPGIRRLAFQLTYFIIFLNFVFINSSILCVGLLIHAMVSV